MALNIKNRQVEELATELARMTGETKTEAIRRALLERRERLQWLGPLPRRDAAMIRLLERDVWSRLPVADTGRFLADPDRAVLLGFRSRDPQLQGSGLDVAVDHPDPDAAGSGDAGGVDGAGGRR